VNCQASSLLCSTLWLVGLTTLLVTVSTHGPIFAGPTKADEIIQRLPEAKCILGKQQYVMSPNSVTYILGDTEQSEFEMRPFKEVPVDSDAVFSVDDGQELTIQLNQSPKNIDAFLIQPRQGSASVETLKKVDQNVFEVSSASVGVKVLEARASFSSGLDVSYIVVINVA
jgi:hypothetical protein